MNATPGQVGARLNSLRARRGRTLAFLADATGIRAQRLAAIEHGAVEATMPELIALTNALPCDISDLTSSPVRDRLIVHSHGTPNPDMVDTLAGYFELDDYLRQ